MTRTVLITRHADDCDELAALLEPHGLTVEPYPVLRVEAVDDASGWTAAAAASGAGRPTWVMMASPRAAARFVEHCRQRDLDALLDAPVAVIGDGTAAAARAAGLEPSLVGPGTGLGLAADLKAVLTEPTTVLFPCGEHRRSELPDALRAAGHDVVPVVVYRMAETPIDQLPIIHRAPAAVVVTSPRSARLYLEAIGGTPLPCPHWALGPTTRDAADELGLACSIPTEPTLESLAEDLCRN